MQHLTALGFVAFVEGIYTQQDHLQLHPSFGHCELEPRDQRTAQRRGRDLASVYRGTQDLVVEHIVELAQNFEM